MIDLNQRLEMITSTLKTAEDWKRKGSVGWEERCLSSALMGYVAVTVRECDALEQVQAYLSNEGWIDLLARRMALLGSLVSEVDRKEMPASILGGNYTHLAFAQVAWSLGEFDLGERVAAIATRDDVLKLSLPFWAQYSKAIQALIANTSYEVGNYKGKRWEQPWMTYLRLIEAATNSADVAVEVAATNEAFRRRNEDCSLEDDPHGIDGCRESPVRWDFRRDGLLRYFDNPRRHL